MRCCASRKSPRSWPLGTARRTAFRKLKGLATRTSYSHRGGYYTLDERVEFDQRGLWSFDGVRISSVGTLIATAESFVNQAQAGHFSEELDNLLHVGAQRPAQARRRRAAESAQARGPVPVLRGRPRAPGAATARAPPAAGHARTRASPARRRPDAGGTARRYRGSPVCSTNGSGVCSPGWSHSSAGGAATGASPACWASTRPPSRPDGGNSSSAMSTSTACGAWAAGARQRKKNAGSHRPPRSPDGARNGRRPGPRAEVDRRTTAKIAAELRTLGIDVCARTVARLLKTMGFSLRVNHKKLAGASHPNRDDQFQRITALRQRCAVENTPMISVDTKKKELVGAFKNAGAKWDRVPELGRITTFAPKPRAAPSPTGSTIRRPIPARSSSARRRWPGICRRLHRKVWRTEGRKRYPQAESLQILADSRQQRLRRLEIPPATSPLQPPSTARDRRPLPHRRVQVESHRTPAFCEISKNWAGRPLDSYETVLKYLRTTRTAAGLRVRAHLVKKIYKTGLKVTDAQMRQLCITSDTSLPRWNYTIEPT